MKIIELIKKDKFYWKMYMDYLDLIFYKWESKIKIKLMLDWKKNKAPSFKKSKIIKIILISEKIN